jgi:SNF2 family DNA or RNA helicase
MTDQPKPMWQHQVDAMTTALSNRDYAFFMEQGTGKSRTTIETLRRVYAEEGRLMRTLILCPQIVCENWKAEWQMFSKIQPHDIVVLKKSGKQRVKDFLAAVGDAMTRSKIVITNYEALQMKELFVCFQHWKPEILVCDESQRLKNPSGTRAKLTVTLAEQTKHNYILTGTPILQSPMDAFMQFRVLDRGETFGKNQWAFKHEYFYDKNAAFKSKQHYFPKWEPRQDKFPVLQSKIQNKSYRVLKKDCLDLPPLIRQNIYVEMSAEQMRAYNEMKRDFITWIESRKGEPRAVVAQLAVTKALRMQQIVSGFARDEASRDHWFNNCPRLDALGELLEDLCPNHKVIVWCSFIENYRMVADLCTKLGLQYREIHGGISDRDKQNNMKDFREDASVRVMIANQAASGVGVNLVEASYMIYYSKNFSLEQDLQSEARAYRGGSEIHEKVTRIDLVTKGSIDEMINEALANKQQIAEKILDVKSFT